MADGIYLDGSQPFHRHEGDTSGVVMGAPHTCIAPLTAIPVHVFDADALAAHDAAVAQQQEQGLPDPPLYRDDAWELALLETPEPGQPVTEVRVLAGITSDGEARRYCTTDRLLRHLRDVLHKAGHI